ncbi:MAG TPA: serine/threonine-protein kinase [Pyrinomonadaceae bacterium]|nr:serine/threonine-protein kinase [Pyrinomonadaceae bacterium]
MDIPQIIAGRFRIECEIGKGGMGTVYRASHLGLERPVAIKVLKQEVASDPEVAERFMREARTMARLRHQRAAMIFDAGRLTDGRPFIVMEYVEGETLADTLAREGTLAPERAVRIASEICDVLDAAHSLGIVHRDLKPSNIMLTERGICVLDFGIAKVLASASDATKTHATTESGLIIGTPRYMSPEQCLGQKVGPASDLYSVGVLVYEMLAGHPPFVDQLSSAVLVKQATCAPPALLSQRPELPRPLALVVHTLLAKNPASRPAKAAEARRLLERSICAPAREEAEVDPFASTIGVLNAGRFAFFRVATACAIVAMLGAVLLAWANSDTRRAQAKDISGEEPAVASEGTARGGRSSATQAQSSTGGSQQSTRQRQSTPESAERIAAAAVSQGTITDARFVRTRDGQAVAALHEDARGTTTLIYLERRAGQYRITSRTALDADGFPSDAKWTAEATDLDGDSYEEVMCTGARAEGRVQNRRYVIFSPRSRQSYSLAVAQERRPANSIRAKWSANSLSENAHAFRAALKQRAFSKTL